jgi:hypothetical protein
MCLISNDAGNHIAGLNSARSPKGPMVPFGESNKRSGNGAPFCISKVQFALSALRGIASARTAGQRDHRYQNWFWGTLERDSNELAPLPKLNVVGSIPIARSKILMYQH